jgi:predicted flap endonuclease-1-like 5' DNA nuclease
MDLKKIVDTLDKQIIKGDIIGAFDKYAADQCVTLSNANDKTTSKAQKLEALKWFFNNIASVNRIERLALKVGENVSDSQFVFDFTNHQGQSLVFHEVIRRTWNNGKIVEELYLADANIDLTEPAPAAAPKKTAKAAPKAEKPAAKKAEKPAAKAEKPAKKTTVTTSTDDLTIIEGIGPKIAELLIAAGISTFAELAAAKPAAIKTILEKAGKRYLVHDPASWPKQATLARDGKTAQLQKLQEELKGGK